MAPSRLDVFLSTGDLHEALKSVGAFKTSEALALSHQIVAAVGYLHQVRRVCVCSVWVPCVALPSGGGSSVGPSSLCGSPVWIPYVDPLCGSPVWVPSVWVPCVGPLCGSLVPGVTLRGIYSRDASRSCSRSRIRRTLARPRPRRTSTLPPTLTSARPPTRAWEVARTVVAAPSSGVKCLWEVFVWGVVLVVCVCVCRCRGCCSLSGCVCV